MNQHVPVSDDTLAKRNAVVLACAQSLGGASPAIVVSLGGIVGSQLVADQAFATVPVSLMQLGIACGVIPAAMLMRRLGRRWVLLHRTVYVAAIAAILHYAWHKAGKNDFDEVLIYGGIVAGLLGMRLYWAWSDKRQHARSPRTVGTINRDEASGQSPR